LPHALLQQFPLSQIEGKSFVKPCQFDQQLSQSAQDGPVVRNDRVVLYFFLGIFVIFIVDSFVRVGKYIR
jgi:hypothetical protein